MTLWSALWLGVSETLVRLNATYSSYFEEIPAGKGIGFVTLKWFLCCGKGLCHVVFDRSGSMWIGIRYSGILVFKLHKVSAHRYGYATLPSYGYATLSRSYGF